MSISCVNIPSAPNGKDSKLFQELRAKTKDRELTKQIWAFTQTDLFKSEFNDLEKDENGEVTYEALSEALGLDSIFSETEKDLNAAIDDGLMSLDGKPKTFDSASTALDGARNYNKKAKNKIAVVSQADNGKFRVDVLDKTPENIINADRQEKLVELNSWLINLLNKLGFNVDFADNPDYAGIFNPLLAEENAEALKTVIQIARGERGMEALPEEVAHLILAGLEGHSLKQRLDTVFTPDIVRRVIGNDYDTYYNRYKNGRTPVADRLRDEAEGKVFAAFLRGESIQFDNLDAVSTAEGRGFLSKVRNLLSRIWNYAKGLFSNASERSIDEAMAEAFSAFNSIKAMMNDESILNVLDKEHIMKHEVLYDLDAKAQRMFDIADQGETTLSKKLSIIESTNNKEDTKELRQTIKTARNQLEQQHYFASCAATIKYITGDVKALMQESEKLGVVYKATTSLERINANAGLIGRMMTAIQGYTPFLETLLDLPTLVKQDKINMDMSAAQQLAEVAKQLLSSLDSLESDAKYMKLNVLKQLISLYYGDLGEAPEWASDIEKANWQSVDLILQQAEKDISFWDTNMFSAGDSRNTLINILHHIIVSQQQKRNDIIFKLCMMMQEARVKLKNAGHDDKFVYQFDENGKPTGYYVGKIDMMKFERARDAFIASLDEQELDYYERQRAINEWEENNMEEVPVGAPFEDGSYRMETLPKESIYGNPNFDAGWSDAQKEYYKSLLDMKADMDSFLPQVMRCLYRAPQVRKSVTQMFDKDGRGALKVLWGKWKQRFAVVSDNIDYNTTVAINFNGREIKRVPVYFTNMMENREDLSTDSMHAMFNYIAMAVNHNEMSQLSNALRLLQEHVNSEDYEVVQTKAGAAIIDAFRAIGKTFHRPLTVEGYRSNIGRAVDAYINRTVFNETKKELGTIKVGNKSLSLDSLFNTLMYITSISRMGINPLSGITNALQGELQIVNEAMSKRFFNMKDRRRAMKEYAALLPEYMGNFNAIDRHDKMYLLINTFNSSEDFFRDMMDKDFNDSPYKRIMGRGNVYFLNTMGEHEMHTRGAMMVLMHEKVKRVNDPDHKEVSLYDVLKSVHDENGWHLELDDDIEFVDKKRAFLLSPGIKGKDIIKKEDRDELFKNLSIYINNINSGMHGGYSEAERGNFNQMALFRAISQFRQWMFGMYNKNYSGSYYDAVMKTQREGTYVSLFKFITGTIHDMKSMSIKMAMMQNNLTAEQKAGAKVAFSQSLSFILLAIACGLSAGLKDDGDRAARLLAYSLKRLETETGALVPYPPTFIRNMFTLVQSPAAMISTLESLANLLDITTGWDELHSGRFKGWSKKVKTLYTLTPIYNIQKLIDMQDYNYMFNIFK